ncbi:MAG TPA: methylated-DNA--[protein]-cysteine S-methyltransferase, partial [Actinomycetota bacterium]|nr:methylated-DNA--[protein]-cysteine S-methyltransferase [Actinomycetota bacterium]
EQHLKRLAGGRDAERRAAEAAEALAEAAAGSGLLDVALGTTDSPVGELLLAVTPRGLAYLAFDDEDPDGLAERLARELSPRILEHPAATDEVRRQLDEYFEGERTRFRLKLDRRLIRGIARDVLAATARIPFGRTSTYGTIAERIGRPRASRAVGNALGANPIPIVVPCHRVLRAGGDVGGYAGGPERKRRLLRLEGALATEAAPRRG